MLSAPKIQGHQILKGTEWLYRDGDVISAWGRKLSRGTTLSQAVEV